MAAEIVVVVPSEAAAVATHSKHLALGAELLVEEYQTRYLPWVEKHHSK